MSIDIRLPACRRVAIASAEIAPYPGKTLATVRDRFEEDILRAPYRDMPDGGSATVSRRQGIAMRPPTMTDNAFMRLHGAPGAHVTRPRPLRSITPVERNVLLLLRTLRHGSRRPAADLAGMLSVAVAPFRDLITFDAPLDLAIQPPDAAFIGKGETALLLAIAAFQRPATIEIQLPDDPFRAALKSCANELRVSGKRLFWRPHLQDHLQLRGWIVAPALRQGAALARRREVAATRPAAPLRGGSLRWKFVQLLRERGTMTARELRAAGASRQYLSLLAADGIICRSRLGVYVIGPRAPEVLTDGNPVTPPPNDAEDCDRHRSAE